MNIKNISNPGLTSFEKYYKNEKVQTLNIFNGNYIPLSILNLFTLTGHSEMTNMHIDLPQSYFDELYNKYLVESVKFKDDDVNALNKHLNNLLVGMATIRSITPTGNTSNNDILFPCTRILDKDIKLTFTNEFNLFFPSAFYITDYCSDLQAQHLGTYINSGTSYSLRLGKLGEELGFFGSHSKDSNKFIPHIMLLIKPEYIEYVMLTIAKSKTLPLQIAPDALEIWYELEWYDQCISKKFKSHFDKYFELSQELGVFTREVSRSELSSIIYPKEEEIKQAISISDIPKKIKEAKALIDKL